MAEHSDTGNFTQEEIEQQYVQNALEILFAVDETARRDFYLHPNHNLHPSDFETQDWLIIIEALGHWASSTENKQSNLDRRQRAWKLMAAVANTIDLSDGTLLDAIDSTEL
ncbi:hypothetical protein [Haladaptatus sp. DYF46]|uniref:hypothetical protein n=1 Tax=Haladaptatus sp. DYF46 TaxID=2886041 RepID=UPI001E523781|nr:hypothetical protein [Haladaptatus sp. DYF46]